LQEKKNPAAKQPKSLPSNQQRPVQGDGGEISCCKVQNHLEKPEALAHIRSPHDGDPSSARNLGVLVRQPETAERQQWVALYYSFIEAFRICFYNMLFGSSQDKKIVKRVPGFLSAWLPTSIRVYISENRLTD
jgi:hypothetical protein